MGWLSSPGTLFKPSRTRLGYLVLGSVAYVVTEFGRFVLRPYVRSEGIHDFGLTACIGNLCGILVMIFLGCAVINPDRKRSYRLGAFFSMGFILYEFVQPSLPKGTFDWLDVYATVIGFAIFLPVNMVLWRYLGPADEPGDREGDSSSA